MSKVDLSIKSKLGINSFIGNFFKLFGMTVIFVPVTIILHELGHYITGFLFQFPDLYLHYGSVSHNAAELNFPFWKRATQAAAGPFITILISLFPCYYIKRNGFNIFVIALGIVTPIRFLVGAVYLFWFIIITVMGGTLEVPNFDEYNIARFTDIPLVLLLVVETTLMIGTWWFLIKQIPKTKRIISLVSIILGIFIGSILWLNVAGPEILP